jgi:TPR repeat protein
VGNTIKQTAVPDDEEIDLDEDGGIGAKKIAFVLLLVLLAVFGFMKFKPVHSDIPVNSPVDSGASTSARFDAAKKAFDASNFPTATKEFTLLAEEGDSKAQYYLGRIYTLDWSASGLGGEARQPADREKSIYWYKKAAEQGELLAQIELGNIYIHNRGGGTNPNEEAFKWLQMAADQGDPDSQYYIGSFYEKGKGVNKNVAQAIAWYRAAADQGHSGGLYGLGMLYSAGEGVTASPLTAYKFLLLAAVRNERAPSVADAFWAREKSKELAKQLNQTELTEADVFVATWKPGQLLPG